MKILIDSANIEEIKRLYDLYPADGITCNPTILSKTGRNPYMLLSEIREFIGPDSELHVQVISEQAEAIVEEAKKILSKLGKQTFIKIPVTPQGLKAIRLLAMQGVNVTGTAVYNSMQGYLAGKAGAKYVAPYINRIDNLGYNGVEVAKEIHDMLKMGNFSTKVLAASFKNSQQLIELGKHGIEASTISPEVIDNLIRHDCVDAAVACFRKDFVKLCGKDKTMLNIE